MELHKLLYSTISTYQTVERNRRNDSGFDAWEFISQEIGHKNPSTLRKMCEPPSENNNAKLGLTEARIIMNTTQDYRLLAFFVNELKLHQSPEKIVDTFFSKPCRGIDEAMGSRVDDSPLSTTRREDTL
jgi:hypothetical protein